MTLAVIIPVYNSSRLLRETLIAVRSGTRSPDELIVVDDGSTDDSAEIAGYFGAQVIVMEANSGPAACRNHAALRCESDLLVFIDADTCVHADTIQMIERHFLHNPTLAAVIGAYDDTPRDPGLCSQYRNLSHCYVHREANRSALTFWSGCGGVRRSVFLAADGFDERFRRPSIEDIEFGYRISDGGSKILLDPSITVTHTKRWTIWNSIRTDIFDRGIPWMVLLLERGNVPDDLNIKKRHRVATGFTGLSIFCFGYAFRSPSWLIPAFLLAASAVCLDAGLLSFIYRKAGGRVLAMAVPMTFVQNVCKLIALVGGLLEFALRRRRSHRLGRGERRSQIIESRREFKQETNASLHGPRS
jgi:GT2 family glycosyltransferase